MNSPRNQGDEFDATIGHELKTWASRQTAPASGRRQLLQAAVRSKNSAAQRRFRPRLIAQLQQWLAGPFHRPQPAFPATELSQWLFYQTAWHNLGIDRRAVRFVC